MFGRDFQLLGFELEMREKFDFNIGSGTTLGSQDGPICCLKYSPATSEYIIRCLYYLVEHGLCL